MEDVLPSYAFATTRDAWIIIAQYIPSSDLCAASLVCRRWHKLLMPFLWGNPASHFGTENDAVYVALTRFRRTLKYARLEVRMLTHTLHLPPALSEIYDGPRPEWLREILEYLPCLQSLIVSKLPFFDHNSMIALRGFSGHPLSSRRYPNIHLLLAEGEPNSTSQGLAETLLRLPALVYLDLSYTMGARDHAVLSTLSELEHLQVLKLRGLRLKDKDAEFLANAIGTKVRFLDLRNNKLTDMALRSLLQASFLPAGAAMRQTQSAHSISTSDFLKSPDLDERFLDLLTRPLTNCFWVTNMPHVGITHLYLADNQITVEGVASLLASTRLHALDVGTVNTAELFMRVHQESCSRAGSSHFPGAEKLIPVLGSCAKDKLTYLRVHHAVVTEDTPIKDQSLNAFLSQPRPVGMAELDPVNQIHELASDVEFRFELADTSIQRPTTSPSRDRRPIYEDEPLPENKRGPVFAPEVLQQGHDESGGKPALDAREAGASGSHQAARNEPDQPLTSQCTSDAHVPASPSSFLSSGGSLRARRIRELLSKRPHNQSFPLRDGGFPYLHPSHVPHLETLVLTDVPSHVPENSRILTSLIRFITACSDESLLATLQAKSDYSLPPGRSRLRAEQQQSRALFALSRLVLEIAPTSKELPKLTPWTPLSYRDGPFRSSGGDRDSEALWSAAINDFSFFGEEECGIPENDPGKYFPMAALNEKVTLVPEDDGPGIPELAATEAGHQTLSSASGSSATSSTTNEKGPKQKQVPEVDLVAELAAFRRAKKAQYEELIWRDRENRRRNTNASAGDVGSPLSATALLSPISPVSASALASSLQPPSPSSTTSSMSSFFPMTHYVEGHWKGEVNVIRNATPKGRSGMVDMYGNYFEKGYLYP
ncbi:hypothetical protein MPDQ_006619 [Monascus purpureus]|uniref:F-box domain-containing protein n=1 Tax=Monascus purpureus TaxID=5098 RepID=A0A507R2E2_MONPU|nr:hypothetical protein MPDQ_006619 [Monascus purpureus]BDD60660.1 hypothetical protein MAP00_005766 [Monascus purpureus]